MDRREFLKTSGVLVAIEEEPAHVKRMRQLVASGNAAPDERSAIRHIDSLRAALEEARRELASN